MSDNDGGPALGGLVERPHDAVLRDRVQTGGGLVKHEDGRVLEDGPGYRHSLLLTAWLVKNNVLHEILRILDYLTISVPSRQLECRRLSANPKYYNHE